MADPPVTVIPQRYDPSVPLDQLVPHPMNANEGDLGLLCELVDANGFAGAVLAQESTGLLIDGEHRLKMALEKGMTSLPVLWLDVDDETRDRLLASLNESTRRGRNDEGKLIALLQGFAGTPKELAGTAFDGDDLDALVKNLNGEQEKPQPPPGDPPASSWGVVVACRDEEEQSLVLGRLGEMGYPVRTLTT